MRNAYFADIRHVVYLTDADGIVLFSLGDEEYQQSFGLLPGSRVSCTASGRSSARSTSACVTPRVP